LAPGAHPMDHAIGGQQLHHRIDRWQDGVVEKVGVIAVVFRLPLDRLAFGGELLGWNVDKRRYAFEPPLCKRLVEHGETVKPMGGKVNRSGPGQMLFSFTSRAGILKKALWPDLKTA